MKTVAVLMGLVLGCAGADGEDGADGAQGFRGEPGIDGVRGPQGEPGAPGPADVVVDTVLCQSDDGATFFSAYVWVLADGDAIGMCMVSEAGTQASDTSPIIGTGCGLLTVQNGFVSIDFSVNPPQLGGGFTGDMNCF